MDKGFQAIQSFLNGNSAFPANPPSTSFLAFQILFLEPSLKHPPPTPSPPFFFHKPIPWVIRYTQNLSAPDPSYFFHSNNNRISKFFTDTSCRFENRSVSFPFQTIFCDRAGKKPCSALLSKQINKKMPYFSTLSGLAKNKKRRTLQCQAKLN